MKRNGTAADMRAYVIGLCAATVMACAESEQGKGYLLRHASLTLPQAVRIAEVSGPGRAVKAELEQKGGQVFYDVEIVDAVNKIRRLRVDAETGKIMQGL